MFTGNIAKVDGGAILAYYCNIQQNGRILFEGNKADNDGGAICAAGYYCSIIEQNGNNPI